MRGLASVVACAAVLGAPAVAHAVEVECGDDVWTCTVNNDAGASVFCDCGDSGFGQVGEEEWADFDEDQLLEICFEQLAAAGDCPDVIEPDTTGGVTTGGVTGGTTGAPTTEGWTGTSGDPSAGESGETSAGLGGSSTTGGTAPESTGSPSSEDDGGPTAPPETTWFPDDDAGSESDSGPPFDPGVSPELPATGCGCNTAPDAHWALLGLLAFGLRRRR